ncbi:MAG: alpha/beta fold hydrolase [Calditrichaeota bacterium]|nr:MAG: alpha/beta fold hydrolase [Calditrichota bacterium]
MSNKKGLLDFHIEFDDEDLKNLFEPFNPPKNLSDKSTAYPVILAHGFARPDYLIDSVFSTLNLSIYDFSFVADRFHYFKGIASHLKKHGYIVYHSRVSWAADVETRSKDLANEVKRILEETGKEKVHIIGHSMGGLDARYMIVNENMAEKVFSLTTIGTPHLGSVIADFVIDNGADKFLGLVGNFMNLGGVKSLTTAECVYFNKYARDAEARNDVVYQVYYSHKAIDEIFMGFQAAAKYIEAEVGKTDGLVSVQSQKWCESLISVQKSKQIEQRKFPIEADHFDQIGWWNLNEFHKAGWWNLSALHEKNKHEEIIKNFYLQIVEDVYKLV